MKNGDKSDTNTTMCFLCGDNKKLIDTAINRDVSPERIKDIMFGRNPCENCKKLMKMGVIVIGFDRKEANREEMPAWFFKTVITVVDRRRIEDYINKLTALNRDSRFLPVLFFGLEDGYLFVPEAEVGTIIGGLNESYGIS